MMESKFAESIYITTSVNTIQTSTHDKKSALIQQASAYKKRQFIQWYRMTALSTAISMVTFLAAHCYQLSSYYSLASQRADLEISLPNLNETCKSQQFLSDHYKQYITAQQMTTLSFEQLLLMLTSISKSLPESSYITHFSCQSPFSSQMKDSIFSKDHRETTNVYENSEPTHCEIHGIVNNIEDFSTIETNTKKHSIMLYKKEIKETQQGYAFCCSIKEKKL